MDLVLSLVHTWEEHEEVLRLERETRAADDAAGGDVDEIGGDDEILMARCNGALVGAVRVTERPGREGAGSSARVSTVVIRHEWRGTALAARLFSAAARLCWTDCVRYVLIDWRDDVRPFLQRLGFRPEAFGTGAGTRPTVVVDFEDAAHRRRLRSPFLDRRAAASAELARLM